MPNAFEKAEKLTATFLGLLERNVLLANLVSRDAGAEYTGAKNDTVNIKRPSRLAGAEQDLRADNSAGITSENLNEWSIPVQLNRHVYSAVDLSDAELTLDVTDFGAQVLAPQAYSVTRRIEKLVAGALAGAPKAGDVYLGDRGAVRRALIEARKSLNKNDVPTVGRYAVIGTDVEASLLDDPNLVQVDQSGSSDVLREGTVGRLYGFTLVVSNDVAPGAIIAFHPSAYILVNRAPVVPASAQGASQSFEGLSARVMRDYNSHTASDRSFVSSYVGIGEVTDLSGGEDPTNARMLRAVRFEGLEGTPPGEDGGNGGSEGGGEAQTPLKATTRRGAAK